MGTVKHAGLDGSEVKVTADADLSRPMSAFGFVRPEGLAAPQPFNIFPAGKSERVLATVRQSHPEIDYELLGDVDAHGGVLRMAKVRRPVATGGHRTFVYGVWEGSKSSITTSVSGERDAMEDVFDRLRFREIATGVAVDSPVDESIRPLRCLKEVGQVLVEVRPLSPLVTRSLPRGRGRAVAHGEMFRRTQASRDVLVVTSTAAVYAAPLDGSDDHVDLAATMAVSWGRRG